MRRLIREVRIWAYTVSIHASVKDATLNRSDPFSISKVSIHASVKDATAFNQPLAWPILVSIHASVKDATSIHLSIRPPKGFQSTHL